MSERNYEVTDLPIEDIFNDINFNCRGAIAPIDVVDLAKDIAHNGLDIPITVQPYDLEPGKKFRIVAGHRRFTAFRVLNRDKDPEVAKKFSMIPCFIKTDFDETAARTFNLRENLHRVALNILQEARHLKYYFDLGLTDKSIAEMTGQTSNWVTVRKALLSLPLDVQEVAAAGLLTQEQIKAAAKIKDKDRLYEYIRRLKDKKHNATKVDVLPPVENKKDLYKEKRQTPAELRQLLNYIYDEIGPNVITRTLAWANGDISTVAIHQEVEKWAKDQGLNYPLPPDVQAAIVGVAYDKPKD